MNAYTYTAPVRIGDKLYSLIDYDDMQVVEELTVTEVGVKGCFVSGSYRPGETSETTSNMGTSERPFFCPAGRLWHETTH